MTHLTEDDLILAYYNEPDGGRAVTHLAECAECRAAAAALARDLSICNQWSVPHRAPDFGRDVWLRLVPELSKQPQAARGWRGFFVGRPFRIGASAAAFAMLLLAVFLAGRFSRPAATPAVMAGLSDQARERILAIAVADHLDRVQILLTEISNSGANAEEFASNKVRAEDLVQEGRLMRQSLATRGETSTTGFLDEVERFLIETAHTPDGASAEYVRDLRDRMEAGSLLFKVRVVESNLRNEEQKL